MIFKFHAYLLQPLGLTMKMFKQDEFLYMTANGIHWAVEK